jgi:acyl carrier protein
MRDATVTTSAIIDLIRTLARAAERPRRLETATISGDTRLADLGLDSLGTLALVEELGQMIGRVLPDDALDPDMTLGKLARDLDFVGATP